MCTVARTKYPTMELMTLVYAGQAWFNLKMICNKPVLTPDFDSKIVRILFYQIVDLKQILRVSRGPGNPQQYTQIT